MSGPGRHRDAATGQLILPELTPAQALWRGTITALVLVLPAAVLNQLVVDGHDGDGLPPAVFLFWMLILLGGAAGGWAVIRLSQSAPLSYAAGAAALSYLIPQTIGVVRRLVAGDPVGWLGYPLLTLLMATAGMLGGMLARRWQRPPQGGN